MFTPEQIARQAEQLVKRTIERERRGERRQPSFYNPYAGAVVPSPASVGLEENQLLWTRLYYDRAVDNTSWAERRNRLCQL